MNDTIYSVSFQYAYIKSKETSKKEKETYYWFLGNKHEKQQQQWKGTLISDFSENGVQIRNYQHQSRFRATKVKTYCGFSQLNDTELSTIPIHLHQEKRKQQQWKGNPINDF